MKKVVLISCSGTKLNHTAMAKDLYASPCFKYSLKYARLLNPNNIFILSAKHGLLDINQQIEPYDMTLNNMSPSKKKKWAEKVLAQLRKLSNLKEDEFIFLAGDNYRKYLLPNIVKYQIPMIGLSIGRQLQFLKNHTTK